MSPARIAEVVDCLRADILATQEILLSQAAEISERTRLPFTFGMRTPACGRTLRKCCVLEATDPVNRRATI